MKSELDRIQKKPFQPVDVQVYRYNMDDLMSASNGYNPFFGEDDPLNVQNTGDDAEKDA